MRYRHPHRAQIWAGGAAALCLLGAVACSPAQPLLPASAFAESFDPFKTLNAVAESEGLAPDVHRGPSTCSRGVGSSIDRPTTTSLACRGTADFRSREDMVRLNRALFAELENEVLANTGRQDIGKGGSPESGELHLQTCPPNAAARGAEPTARSCLFLHAYAVEVARAPGTVGVSYFFTLDEERTRPTTADQPAGG